MQSPLSKDVMLADKVGLSKTIEVALVLCQLRAVAGSYICPAALRKQWASEEVDHIAVVDQVQLRCSKRHRMSHAWWRMVLNIPINLRGVPHEGVSLLCHRPGDRCCGDEKKPGD